MFWDRSYRLALLGIVFALASACSDGALTSPEPDAPEGVQFDYSYPTPGFDWDDILPPPPGDCDPLTAIIECDDGSGGGSAGGSSDDVDICLNCFALSKAQVEKIERAVNHVCSTYKTAVRGMLVRNPPTGRRHLGARSSTASSARGWHFKRFHPDVSGTSDYHYAIHVRIHPGFTGKMDTGTQQAISATQQLIMLAGTLVHEYLHHQYKDLSHFGSSGINARTKACVPAYDL